MAEEDTGKGGSRPHPAKKAAAKRSTAAKRSASKKATSTRSESQQSATAAPKPTEIAEQAARQLVELTGRRAQSVTGLERSDEGWTVQVEVLEVSRVPDTTDVLALYVVETDGRGDLVAYRRLRRYVRGTPSEE